MNLREELKKILHNWARGGYNDDECDVYSVLEMAVKKHSYCKECLLSDIVKMVETGKTRGLKIDKVKK